VDGGLTTSFVLFNKTDDDDEDDDGTEEEEEEFQEDHAGSSNTCSWPSSPSSGDIDDDDVDDDDDDEDDDEASTGGEIIVTGVGGASLSRSRISSRILRRDRLAIVTKSTAGFLPNVQGRKIVGDSHGAHMTDSNSFEKYTFHETMNIMLS
jgi:hypothetical protein